MAVFYKKPNCDTECLPQDFSAVFWESLWIDPDKPLLFFTFPCLFLFTAVNTIIPSRDLFKRCMLRAISSQRVYKVTALMDLWKEVVFFSARVGGGSEASCLSSFKLIFCCHRSRPLFFFSHESAALQSALSGFRSTRRCQGSCPGFYTYHRLY